MVKGSAIALKTVFITAPTSVLLPTQMQTGVGIVIMNNGFMDTLCTLCPSGLPIPLLCEAVKAQNKGLNTGCLQIKLPTFPHDIHKMFLASFYTLMISSNIITMLKCYGGY